jgi:cobalt-zinc-cadmium efflux system membrane fusion protein
METGDYRVLESGISPGEELVLNGAFHLNNQRKQDMVKGDN